MNGGEVVERLRELAVDEELPADARAALLAVLIDRDRRGLRTVGPFLYALDLAARDAVRGRATSAAVVHTAHACLAAWAAADHEQPRSAVRS